MTDDYQPGDNTGRTQEQNFAQNHSMPSQAQASYAAAAPATSSELIAQGDNTQKRQEQALMFEKYLEESGLCLSFQIIFTEIIQKQIPEDQVFPYTAMRLRQIGKELEAIDGKAGSVAH